MRIYHFLIFFSCSAVFFMTWTTYHSNFRHSTIEENFYNPTLRGLVCAALREKYAPMKSLKITDKEDFLIDIMLLLSCSWEANSLVREKYRVGLHSCCNATEELVLTRQNMKKGQHITYETEKKNRLVDDSLFNMFPESIPWKASNLYKRCAVVGNSGILKNSSCGSTIDQADFVIRMNLAPINFSRDVGVKTNMITANPTQIMNSYPKLKEDPKPLEKKMSDYGNAALLMPAFSFQFCTATSFQVYKALHPKRQVLFFNPKYLQELHSYWRERGQKAYRLSTGLIMASIALELCEEVHLYGFWPFYFDLSQRPLTNHYYDDIKATGLHAMPTEFLQLLNLHSVGVIHLHIGQCQ
ncbi:hypothetical protein GJAV_G00196920 [Gymnothorax javanicus]|nr:hypothetical protein GJAV_G00196920 [Gymnothorax javanicus]